MAAAPQLAIHDSEFTGMVGVARGDITPPAGIFARSWGSAKHDIASGVHKPLLATCVVFADAAQRSTANFCLATFPLTFDREILPIPGLAFDAGLPDVVAHLLRSILAGGAPNKTNSVCGPRFCRGPACRSIS